MIENFESVNRVFEKAVTQLQENLQYLANQGKVSNQFIAIQNNIIKALINYQNITEKLIGSLQWENLELSKGKVKEIQRLKDVQESFEAICIIHGVMDFPAWMNKGKRYLVSEAIREYRSNKISIPYALKNKLDQLPKEEKDILDKILYKEYHNEIADIQQKINDLKIQRDKKRGQSGTR